MRLDKYLKLSRIIKRRTIAKDISNLGFVKVNDKDAKPSTIVKDGDILELTLAERVLTIRIITTEVSLKKDEAKASYEIISDEFKA